MFVNQTQLQADVRYLCCNESHLLLPNKIGRSGHFFFKYFFFFLVAKMTRLKTQKISPKSDHFLREVWEKYSQLLKKKINKKKKNWPFFFEFG